MSQHTKSSQITIERGIPDENHLAWGTLRRLGDRDPPMGSDNLNVLNFVTCMRHQTKLGTRYANPAVLVIAQKPCREFIIAARREQRTWFKRLNSWLFSSGRVKRHYTTVHPIIRQLEFTGVLLLDGKHLPPDRWPKPEDLPSTRSLVGQKFSRLTVIEELPQQMCRCRCECGNVKVARRKHLLAGRSKSCGCLRANQDARNQNRKRTRAWLCSQELRS